MKISYNWLKSYVDIDLPAEELADLLTDIGLEVEGFEPYESIKGSLDGIVIGWVKTAIQHPDADKLKLTTVDVGTEELQIVCGAPNVAAGQKVAVALVGTTLYDKEGKSFQIGKAKIRSVASFGMICSEVELNIGNSHEGILVLQDSATVGQPLSAIYPVEKDIVFEIGLTPNRSDAFHHIGVARDLIAAINFRTKKQLTLNWPKTADFTATQSQPVKVSVPSKAACPRYAGVVLQNLKVAPSPTWLQNRLKAIGQRPINNIVDITNFVMHEYGQPLHAFDLAVVGNEIQVKTLPDQTAFTTLDNEVRMLSEEDLMICNANSGMCIAGVFGGAQSGVKKETTAIFLESAYFSPRSIRRTSTRHGLRTDAAMHFEKGIDPNITIEALKRAALLIQEIAGGQVVSEITDIQNQSFPHFKVSLRWEQLNKMAGMKMPKETVKQILALLEILIVLEDETMLQLEVPPYRADVTREADIIEEVIRIYGFNAIPIPEKINASIQTAPNLTSHQLYEKIAGNMVAKGFYEIMVNSISRDKYYDTTTPIRLMNNLNAELTIMRESMVYSGLEPIRHNINHRNANCQFFELGKQYAMVENQIKEEEKLSLWLTGKVKDANWIEKGQEVDFYYLKSVVEQILEACGIRDCKTASVENGHFKFGQTFGSRKTVFVQFGLLSTSVLKKLDIEQPVYYAEFDWESVLKAAQNAKTLFAELPKYPSTRRDLALLVNKETSFDSLQKIGKQYGKEILRKVDLFDSYQDKNMDPNKKSYAISFIFRDNHKTLNDKEVDGVMNKLIEAYKRELGATIR
jgi:phenylalanyl-tRNA synthetase beta chain